MAETTYTFSVSTQFPASRVAPDRWAQEIRLSPIVTALAQVHVAGDVARATFRDALSPADEATLNSIVAAHSGQPIADVQAAKEADGRLIVAPFPAMVGANTSFTGRGDDLVNGIPGKGPHIRLAWTDGDARGPKEIDLGFLEPIQLHDGGAYYQGNWTPEDTLTVRALMPATTATPNAGGTGNCNLVPIGPGAFVIVPAAGDGGHDVALASAVPVPAPLSDGFWDVDEPSGIIVPSAEPGHAKWHLLTVPQTAAFLNEVPLGALTGVFDIDVYRAEYFHPTWTLRVVVDKQSDFAGSFAGWFLVYRRIMPA